MSKDDHSRSAPETLDAIVIGGGISGLATANALARKGKRVHVLEKADEAGGAVRSERREGFLVEAGPNSMMVKSQRVWDFIEELGLGPDRVEANPLANKRFLVKNSRIVALPQTLSGGVTTPLYSPLEKLRLLKEPFVGRSKLKDESVTSFVSRRMGPAFLEYGISALVSGIFAGNPDTLSIRHGFPKVWNLEQKYGSLIGGALKLKRERKREGIVPFKSRIISFREGLAQLAEALANQSGLTLRTGVDVQAIRREDTGGWIVETKDKTLHSGKLVIATPLRAHSELPFPEEVRKTLLEIPQIDHPPLSTLVLGFRREQVGHPLDGFGVLFPRMEKRFCLGCIFSTTLFPGRAPDGKVSLMCFIGGVQQPENGSLPTEEMVRETVRDLAPLLDLKGDPEFQSHAFWPEAIPQYNVGHQVFLNALESAEETHPGLFLRGNFRGGPGLNDCVENALVFADGES